jgi:uncharacterized membrane-anchored protein YhcB (DUF1043 family)
MSEQQLWGAVVVIIVGYIVGFYFQHRDHAALRSEMNVRLAALNKRIDDLRSEVNARFEDFRELLHSEIQRIEGLVHTAGRN